MDSVLFLLLQKEKAIKINDNTCYKSSNEDLFHNINNANKIRFDDNSNTTQIPRDDGGTVPAFEVKDYLLGGGLNVVIIEEYENLM